MELGLLQPNQVPLDSLLASLSIFMLHTRPFFILSVSTSSISIYLIYLDIHLSSATNLHLSIYSLIHYPFNHTCTSVPVYPSDRIHQLFIYLSAQYFIYLFIHSSIIHSTIHQYTYSSIYLLNTLSIYSLIHYPFTSIPL